MIRPALHVAPNRLACAILYIMSQYKKINIFYDIGAPPMQMYEADGQAKDRRRRRTSYFCRLCREYGIVNRKSHLKWRHNVSHDTINKRSSADLINIIFVESIGNTASDPLYEQCA